MAGQLSKRKKSFKIAVIGMFHETNTFAPGMTGLEHFAAEWVAGTEAFMERYTGTRTSMGGIIDAAAGLEIELCPGLYVSAMPSGMVSGETAAQLIRELVGSVDADIDGLIAVLHGAMVSEHIFDMEAELLRELRGKTGSRLPLAATLDLHANISAELVASVDILVGYDTYPHVDAYERAMEAMQLLAGVIDGTLQPCKALAQPGMLVAPQTMLTDQGAMREIMELAFQMETLPDVLNVTVAGGFPYSDMPDAGFSVVVTTNGQPQLAQRLVEDLADFVRLRKERFRVQGLTAEQSVRLAEQDDVPRPAVIVEGSDNVGGGAPADATHVLRYLVGTSRKAIIVICDPAAVAAAVSRGIGGQFDREIGGNSGELHGRPVFVSGVVRTLSDGKYRHVGAYMTGQWADMGRSAVVDCGQLTVVLTENRVAPWDAGHLLCLGLDAASYNIIVVKSAIAWKTAFGELAKTVIEADTPGCCSFNLLHFPYAHVRRPIFPLDADC